MASRFVIPNADVGNGIQPEDGAKLTFFETGTSTLKDTFSNSSGTIKNANPVIANASGVFPDIFIVGTYKVTLTDKDDVQTGFGEADPVDEFAKTSGSVFVKNFDTLALALLDIELVDGDAIKLKERTTGNFGCSNWKVVLLTSVTPSIGAPTIGNIVVSTGVPTLALVLIENTPTERRPSQWGSVNDGVVDDSAAWQLVIDDLPTGGLIRFAGTPLVGGLTVTTQRLTIRGDSLINDIKVKNGTTGITFRDHWCGVEHCTVKSQGTRDDGLGTNGLLWESTPTPTSKGFTKLERLNLEGFSGFGLKSIDTIDFHYEKGYVVSCITGVSLVEDVGGVSFGTTAFVDQVYFTSCTTGLLMDQLFRSEVSKCVFEFCNFGIDAIAGSFTVMRCYFENNTTAGLRSLNSATQDLWNFKHSVLGNNQFDVTFDGATAAATRGRIQAEENDYSWVIKKLGLTTLFGTKENFLESMGTTDNIGLMYGTNNVALIRGENLFVDADWVNVRFDEFKGWNITNEGFEVSGVTAGLNTYGIQQSVTLDDTKTYVMDIALKTVQGAAISTLRFDAQVVASGVPFVPDTNGANLFKAFGTEGAAVTIESYIKSITVSEVIQDNNQIAQANARLTALRPTRGDVYMTSIPTTGVWQRGEIVRNSLPSVDGNNMVLSHWICTVTGNVGTFVFVPQYISTVTPAT